MGVAAYRRGNAMITRQIESDARPVEFQRMSDLNALPKFPGARAPWGDEVHIVRSHRRWWVECPITGYGYHYATLREAVRSWDIHVIGYAYGVWTAIRTLEVE